MSATNSSLSRSALDPSPLRLEDMADIFGTGHFNRVARRYSGEKGINGKAAAREALSRTFANARRLDALAASLHPTELQLLGEVRRRGGTMDGWALYTFARLRGLKAPPVKLSPSSSNLFEGYQGADFPGADLIWSLFADGLLVPVSVPNHWLRDAYAYYRHRPFPNLPATWVLADPRLLTHLPPVEALPLTVKLGGVQPPTVQNRTSPAARLALHLQEVLRGLRVLGGLGLTQAGTYNKSGLGKLNKLLPALEEPGFWLAAAQSLGLLQVDVAGKQVRVCAEQERALTQAGPQHLVKRLAGLVGVLAMPEDQAHRLPYAGVLRSCLLTLLRDLPGAITESELLRVMSAVIPAELRLPVRDYRVVPNPQAWPDWFGATLRGTMTDFGLVSLEDRDGQAVVTPGEALDTSTVHSEPSNPAAGAALAPVPAPPAWILQPNFELLVYPAHLQPHQFAILYAAEAVRFDAQTATYRLTRDSVYAALEGGLSQADLVAGLQSGSATPLAPSVESTIRDWAARRERLTVHQGVTLLEYPTRSKRDAALSSGGTPVGETLLMLASGQKVQPGISILKYDQVPPKTLKFGDDGTFTITSELDFLTRQLLEGRIAAVGKERYLFRPALAGGLPTSFLNDLEARSSGRLPSLLRLQLGVWSGQTPPPRLAAVTLLQHPQAQGLAQHPALKGLIGGTVGPNLFAVPAGQEQALETALRALGLTPHRELLAPQGAASDLVMITDTRKKREFLEEAIRNGHNLLIQFNEEKTVGGWYSSRATPGKRRLDEFQPLRVDRAGNTPYLDARNLKSSEEERIRIQYILGIAIR
ncbi:helicase-associated domain-containing protein (plasmid) [Deinococcus taeanensis]|uniref:helicase-associated domain-containing protein n=1 Tax=Deinococcus taeanensis TaxID=2737050 RepID=UPI001CDB9748|nr:helicase-associated domain-containing protein [Deinococcus taeanensis]UBV44711.1 helicase-associated domain-containing protein [Deinococcus taeanensis]